MRPPRKRAPIVPFRAGEDAAFSLRCYRRAPTGRPLHAAGLHGHRFFTLNCFDEGRGTLRFTRGELQVAPGVVGLELPGELYDASGLLRMRGWVVEFTEELLDEGALPATLPLRGMPWLGFAVRPWGTPLFARIPPADRPGWDARLARLARELDERRMGSREAARALLHVALIDLLRLLAPDARPIRVPALVAEVFAVIERRYAEPISLAAVARAVGRSGSHVTAAVRRETGMTVLEWITERRLAEARRRLSATDEDVAVVAERVGYDDSSYFTRLFRRAHGLTPRAFRAANR